MELFCLSCSQMHHNFFMLDTQLSNRQLASQFALIFMSISCQTQTASVLHPLTDFNVSSGLGHTNDLELQFGESSTAHYNEA